MTKFQMIALLIAVVLVVTGGLAVRGFAAGKAKLPQVGQMAPNFTLPNQEGAPVRLSSYRGQWVVLYFYPKDMTSGCTIEAHNFQRDLSKYEALHATILGVSVDSVKSHAKFCTKDSLHFTLLSDHGEMRVSREYGVLANLMGLKFDKRITFLIDPKGKIAKVWTGVNPMKHSAEVLAELEKRKSL
ncbi:MAG: peroxiredoxin [Acidobacteriaceae bacterium]